MSESLRTDIELALKILAILIAVFGVWKYFADKEAMEISLAQERSIGYIEKYGSDEMSAARETLFGFWQSQGEFINHLKSNQVTQREYRNFVRFVFPRYEESESMQRALFAMANLYDQIFHCRKTRICDNSILDDYFCPISLQDYRVYGPFYELMRSRIASSEFGASLQRYAQSCSG